MIHRLLIHAVKKCIATKRYHQLLLSINNKILCHYTIGKIAENLAYHYLIQQGLLVKARNYRTCFGEIDLVMQDHHTLVFVEVRLRSQTIVTSAIASIDYHKQQRLIKTAQMYLQQLPQNQTCRFDVIALQKQSNKVEIKWLKNAFDVT